jgi:hypothetical protein
MSRSLNSTITTALAADVIQPFFAIDLLFDSPNEVYLWNGVGTRSLTRESGGSSESYAGAGELLQIEPIEETGDISAKGATITLSGIDNSASSLFVKALATPYHGRVCKIYFGVMNGNTPSNIEQIFTGYMDQMNIDEGPDSTTITLTVENKLVSLERPSGNRYTSAYQKEKHSGDKGLDFVVGLQTKKIIWGAVPE